MNRIISVLLLLCLLLWGCGGAGESEIPSTEPVNMGIHNDVPKEDNAKNLFFVSNTFHPEYK